MRNADRIALDRASVRSVDQDGHLHVSVANISKATVSPYRGAEIPDAEALGLDPGRIYYLFRDPAELAKGAASFAGKPLLSRHRPVTAADHSHDLTVGAVGQNVIFDGKYLKAPLVVWDDAAIDGINTNEQRELSAAYRYVAVMQPGTFEGQRYDGRMTEIFGNHVALVSSGRSGRDVVVGDAALQPFQTEMIPMATHRLSRTALLATGTLRAYLRPKLAADQKVDLNPILASTSAKTWNTDKNKIKLALDQALAGRLAADADIGDVVQILDQLDDAVNDVAASEQAAPDVPDAPDAKDAVAVDPDPGAPGDLPDPEAEAETDPVAQVLALLTGKLSPEDLAAVTDLLRPAPAEDTAPNPFAATEKDKPMPKPGKTAMDAAIRAAVQAAEKSTIARMNEIREAEQFVRPWVGTLAMAQDSATGVYKLALDTLLVDVKDIHPSAYRAILAAQRKPGDAMRLPARVAMDAEQDAGFAERFPKAGLSRFN